MTVTGVTDYAILAILKHRLHYIDCNCTSIAPFGLPGPATLAGVIGCGSACACTCICPPGPPAHLPEACCCGGAAGVVSGLFRRSSRGTASEVCRLWIPAAWLAMAVAAHRGRVCPCEQLTYKHQILIVVYLGSDSEIIRHLPQ
jgi:hypothetical protein